MAKRRRRAPAGYVHLAGILLLYLTAVAAGSLPDWLRWVACSVGFGACGMATPVWPRYFVWDWYRDNG